MARSACHRGYSEMSFVTSCPLNKRIACTNGNESAKLGNHHTHTHSKIPAVLKRCRNDSGVAKCDNHPAVSKLTDKHRQQNNRVDQASSPSQMRAHRQDRSLSQATCCQVCPGLRRSHMSISCLDLVQKRTAHSRLKMCLCWNE